MQPDAARAGRRRLHASGAVRREPASSRWPAPTARRPSTPATSTGRGTSRGRSRTRSRSTPRPPSVTRCRRQPEPVQPGVKTTTIRFRAADALSGTCHADIRILDAGGDDREELQQERGVRGRRHRDVDDLGRPQHRPRARAARDVHDRGGRDGRSPATRRPSRAEAWSRSERRGSAPGLGGQDDRDRPGKRLLAPRDDRAAVGGDRDVRSVGPDGLGQRADASQAIPILLQAVPASLTRPPRGYGRRRLARSWASFSGTTGFVRCASNPASSARRRSCSVP